VNYLRKNVQARKTGSAKPRKNFTQQVSISHQIEAIDANPEIRIHELKCHRRLVLPGQNQKRKKSEK
jgi:hypothetical protein